MPTRLAFRTILGSSENGVALVPETGIEQNDPIPAEPAIPIATKTK
jgi:hypothetical protein